MGEVLANVSLSMSGEWLTDFVRTWYFKEHKPYEKCEELLLSCMCGTEQTKDELVKLAHGVLMGDYKFVGDTRSGTFTLVDDGEFNGFLEIDKQRRYQEKLKEEENKRIQEELANMDDEDYDNDEYEGRKVIYAQPKGIFGSSLVDSFLKANRFEDNYGWLKPDGTFIPVEFGDHLTWADVYVMDNNDTLGEEYNLFMKDVRTHQNGYEGDFLIYQKGWVLLHNPAQGIANPTYDEIKGMTKAQKEFLYDYYIERGEEQKANDIWSEE